MLYSVSFDHRDLRASFVSIPPIFIAKMRLPCRFSLAFCWNDACSSPAWEVMNLGHHRSGLVLHVMLVVDFGPIVQVLGHVFPNERV